MPIKDPGWIIAAASSALITRCAKDEFKTLELVEAIETFTFLFLNLLQLRYSFRQVRRLSRS
jgi:hypothetical protein